MTETVTRYLEAGFALLVTGLALTPWPWLALLGGAGYLVTLAAVNDRRTESK